MPKNYTVTTRIARPIHDVFNAIVSADRLSRYFTNQSSGDLRVGDRVVWHWNDYGDSEITVSLVEADHRIELVFDSNQWKKTPEDSYDVRVTFDLEAVNDDETKLSISESGWKTDAAGLKGSHDNCSGWTHMAMCLKAYIEHGIDLR